MNLTRLLRLFAFSLLPLAALAADKSSSEKNCGCSCCTGKDVCCCFVEEAAAADKSTPSPDSEKSDTAVARHPLRGTIVAVRPDDSALLVKHEEIPGYMRAMTMLFKVDPALLPTLKKGDAITATLVQRDDGFHLENITKR